MNRGSMRAQDVPLCPNCGRILEPYETCDCALRLPRDGLRASCPAFKSRSTFRGKNYINCAGRKLRFESRDDRDRYYMDNCCNSSRVSEGAATSPGGIFDSQPGAAGRCRTLQCGRCVPCGPEGCRAQHKEGDVPG